jgi:DNA invertase Pin-like site-specific DNA recombinase
MAKTIGYIQISPEEEQMELIQKAAITDFAGKNQLEPVEYIKEEIAGYVSWRERILGKKIFAELKEGDSLIVSEMGRLGNSSAEINAFLTFLSDKGINVYVAKTGIKIA